MTDRPKIGIGVLVYNNNKILLGKRVEKGSRYSWSMPGGHLEFGESTKECAIREVREETGIKIKNISRGPYVDMPDTANDKHYVTLSFIGEYASGELGVPEPDRFIEWCWFSFDKLPSPLFLPSKQMLTANGDLSATKTVLKPGIYRHYKGNYYMVLGCVTDAETSLDAVLYRALYNVKDGTLTYVRPLHIFLEEILVDGKLQPRFKHVM